MVLGSFSGELGTSSLARKKKKRTFQRFIWLLESGSLKHRVVHVFVVQLLMSAATHSIVLHCV